MAKPTVLAWVTAEYPRARSRSTAGEPLRTLPMAASAVIAGLLAVFVVIALAASVVTLLR
jgi:hypothetical protein